MLICVLFQWRNSVFDIVQMYDWNLVIVYVAEMMASDSDMDVGPFSVTQPNPTQPMTLQTQSTTYVVTRESWPNPIQPNIEQQHNIVQIGYINQKPISK